MAIDPSSAAPGSRRVPSLVLLLVGAASAVYGATGMWSALDSARHGVAATATIIEYHGTSARTHSIVAQVEVTVPGGQPVRAEVYDGLGLGTWTDGGTIDLWCSSASATHAECGVASPLDRWLLPVSFFMVGLVFVWWSRRMAR